MKNCFLIILSLVFFSCGETNKEKQPEVITVETEAEIHKPADLQAEFKAGLIEEIYKNYNAVKSALVNSDPEKVQKAAKNLVETLQKTKFSSSLGAVATEMSKANNLEAQRKAFSSLTEKMLPLVETNLNSGKLYYQYCPMAFQGKGGYWLSNGKEIRNPYFGDKMLKCGRVEKVIN
ncbi:MAG TPA: DUF3347 domain-containing protein [Salinimicrobium sp.]|nr:DUF3347 domain-containing protein [Salinimicrobium sp.]